MFLLLMVRPSLQSSLATLLKACLDIFAKSNRYNSEEKTEALIRGQEYFPTWLVKWKITQPRNVIHYIGIAFGVDEPLESLWDWILHKIKFQLQIQLSQDILRAGRITIQDLGCKSRFIPLI
jgi:hypothetical protein